MMVGRTFNCVVLSLLALAALAPQLLEAGYQLTSPEFLVLNFFTVFLAAFVSYSLKPSGKLINAVIALAVYWIIDAYFVHSLSTVVFAFLAAFVIYRMLFTGFRENIVAALITFCIFWLSSNAYLLPEPVLVEKNLKSDAIATLDKPLPPVVHIVLDEFMSPTAIPETIPKGHPAEHIVENYASRGFDFHSQMNSISYNTNQSLSALVGLSNSMDNYEVSQNGFNYRVKSNQYFAALRDRGYSIQVIESTYMDYCTSDSVTACERYQGVATGSVVSDTDIDLPTKLYIAATTYRKIIRSRDSAGGIFLYWGLEKFLDKLGFGGADPVVYGGASFNLKLLDALQTRLSNIERGKVYFSHFMMPHYPYTVDADCKLNNFKLWRSQVDARSRVAPDSDAYRTYWDQAVCANNRVLELVDIVLKQKNAADTIFIIHGDHGARLSLQTTKNAPDLYQTFVAVKSSESQGRVIGEGAVLQDFFRTLVLNLGIVRQK